MVFVQGDSHPEIPARRTRLSARVGIMSGTSWRKVEFAHHTRSRKRGNRCQRCQGPVPPGPRTAGECRRAGRPESAGRGYDRPVWRGRLRQSSPGRPGANKLSGFPPARCRPARRASRKPLNGASGGHSGCGRRRSASASLLHCQVAASAASCSPISRLARRIEGGMMETSAISLSSASPAGRLARAARHAEATSTPSSGPSTWRSQFKVQPPGLQRLEPVHGRSRLPVPTSGCNR